MIGRSILISYYSNRMNRSRSRKKRSTRLGVSGHGNGRRSAATSRVLKDGLLHLKPPYVRENVEDNRVLG